MDAPHGSTPLPTELSPITARAGSRGGVMPKKQSTSRPNTSEVLPTLYTLPTP